MEYDPFNIRNIFTITPSSGNLLPYEYLMAVVGFNPPPNAKIQAVLLCNVEGGEPEKIVLKGITAGIKYKFDKDKIEFKRKVWIFYT